MEATLTKYDKQDLRRSLRIYLNAYEHLTGKHKRTFLKNVQFEIVNEWYPCKATYYHKTSNITYSIYIDNNGKRSYKID